MDSKRNIIIVSVVVTLIIVGLILGLVFGLRGRNNGSEKQQLAQQPVLQQAQQPIFPQSQQPVLQQSQQPVLQQSQQPIFPQSQQPVFQQAQQPVLQQSQPIYDPLPSYVPVNYNKWSNPVQTPIKNTNTNINTNTVTNSNNNFPNTTSQDEIDMWVNAHNTTRSQVGLSPVTWSQKLANDAKVWANNCVFEHADSSIRKGAGENLAIGSPASFYESINGMKNLAQGWIDEKNDYNYPNPVGSDTGNKQTGHYTQMVYRPLKEIGCACSDNCSDGSKLCVCRYDSIQQSGRPPY